MNRKQMTGRGIRFEDESWDMVVKRARERKMRPSDIVREDVALRNKEKRK